MDIDSKLLLSMVESTLAMATLFLLRTVVARSEFLLLCMYGARVRDSSLANEVGYKCYSYTMVTRDLSLKTTRSPRARALDARVLHGARASATSVHTPNLNVIDLDLQQEVEGGHQPLARARTATVHVHVPL